MPQYLKLNSPPEHFLYSVYGIFSLAVWNFIFEKFISVPFGIYGTNDLYMFGFGLICSTLATSSMVMRVMPFSWGRLFLHNFRILFFSILFMPLKTQFSYYVCMDKTTFSIWIAYSVEKTLGINIGQILSINHKREEFLDFLKIAEHECQQKLFIYVIIMVVLYLLVQVYVVWYAPTMDYYPTEEISPIQDYSDQRGGISNIDVRRLTTPRVHR
jgi:hypothetical protein